MPPELRAARSARLEGKVITPLAFVGSEAWMRERIARLAPRVLSLRKRGLTYQAISNIVGLSRSAVYNIVTGRGRGMA